MGTVVCMLRRHYDRHRGIRGRDRGKEGGRKGGREDGRRGRVTEGTVT